MQFSSLFHTCTVGLTVAVHDYKQVVLLNSTNLGQRFHVTIFGAFIMKVEDNNLVVCIQILVGQIRTSRQLEKRSAQWSVKVGQDNGILFFTAAHTGQFILVYCKLLESVSQNALDKDHFFIQQFVTWLYITHWFEIHALKCVGVSKQAKQHFPIFFTTNYGWNVH